MSDFTLKGVPWAPGTAVGAYPRRSEVLPEVGPPGVAAETQNVAADASLTYTTLPDGEYRAGAAISGTWRYVSFIVKTPAPQAHIDNPRRSSDVSTFVAGADGISTQAPALNNITAASAVCVKAGTFTKARFCVGSALTATDVRVVVANASRQVIGESANLIAVPPPGGALSINTFSDLIPLLVAVSLLRDQIVYLGLANAGTAFSFMGNSCAASPIGGLGTPQRISSTAWAGGALPASLGSGSTSREPWVELIP